VTDCEKCGEAISEDAKTCPHCGHPREDTMAEKSLGCLDVLAQGCAAAPVIIAAIILAPIAIYLAVRVLWVLL
jgi:uncharacterized membrane protein YvbJ